jgi:hypothetical protein
MSKVLISSAFVLALCMTVRGEQLEGYISDKRTGLCPRRACPKEEV